MEDTRRLQRYRKSWHEIMEMVRSGASWSGREKNCVFLNCQAGAGQDKTVQFADISAVSGMGFPDDARSMGVLDWDQDGDLDVWIRNRTAPRLRVMLNRTDQLMPNRKTIAVKLRGVACNRDAIGARVEMVSPPGRRQLRSVTAGDGFISQSSKWLHFAADQEVSSVTVHWPGGNREIIHGLDVAGRYLVQQGAGEARRVEDLPKLKIAPKVTAVPGVTDSARIVLPGRIPLPDLTLVPDSTSLPSTLGTRPTLVVFWTRSCASCRSELANLAAHQQAFDRQGLAVLTICLDGLGTSDSVAARAADDSVSLPSIRIPFAGATTTAASMQKLQHFQNGLFDSYPKLVVPFSLLVDSDKKVIALYRGAFSAEVLLDDFELFSMSDQQLRDAAVPFAGSWFTKPATQVDLAEYMGRRMISRDVDEGLRYYQIALESSQDEAKQKQLRQVLVTTQLRLARSAGRANEMVRSARYFQAALQVAPDSNDVHRDYAVFLARSGEFEKAESHLREALRIRPEDPVARKNLQLLLKRKKRD